MTNYVIKVETGHVYITPIGFWKYAEDFYTASVNWKYSGKYSPVPYFSICRSIELTLKAFLLTKGVKMKDVKNPKTIGHNLIYALNESEKFILSDFILTTDSEREELIKANEYYKQDKKRFEYFVIENLTENNLPDLNVLQDYALRLLKNTHDYIVKSA